MNKIVNLPPVNLMLMSEVEERRPELVYAVGGGLVADASKYLAASLDLPLVVVPTALSVDAFFTAASGIRQAGCVYYLPTKVPETVIMAYFIDCLHSGETPAHGGLRGW